VDRFLVHNENKSFNFIFINHSKHKFLKRRDHCLEVHSQLVCGDLNRCNRCNVDLVLHQRCCHCFVSQKIGRYITPILEDIAGSIIHYIFDVGQHDNVQQLNSCKYNKRKKKKPLTTSWCILVVSNKTVFELWE